MGIGQTAETALVRLGFALARALGPVGASNLGGYAARTLGPLLPVSNVARRNIAMALPELTPRERERVVRGVWDNLGRTVAELPHVADLTATPAGPGYECEGLQHLPPSGPALLVSGHLGNWEVLPLVAARTWRPVAGFYRAASNSAVDALIAAERRRGSPAPGFAKGARGARQALAWLREGGGLGMLVDQKMNDGIETLLFGHKAMSAPAAAAFALRFDCPIIPAHTVRLGPARLRVVIEQPLQLTRSKDRSADVAALTQAVNDRLEAWIRAEPAQWLWLHRRWPKEATAALPDATPAAALVPPAPPYSHPRS